MVLAMGYGSADPQALAASERLLRLMARLRRCQCPLAGALGAGGTGKGNAGGRLAGPAKVHA
jgi:hypothetical protein